jgi:hypothetical protein
MTNLKKKNPFKYFRAMLHTKCVSKTKDARKESKDKNYMFITNKHRACER